MMITARGCLTSLVHVQGAKIVLSALAQVLSPLTEQQPATQPTQLHRPTAYPPPHPLSSIKLRCQILSNQQAQRQLSGALRPPPGPAWMPLQLSRQDTVPCETGSKKQSLLHQHLSKPCMLCCCLMRGAKDILGLHIK